MNTNKPSTKGVNVKVSNNPTFQSDINDPNILPFSFTREVQTPGKPHPHIIERLDFAWNTETKRFFVASQVTHYNEKGQKTTARSDCYDIGKTWSGNLLAFFEAVVKAERRRS